MPDSKQIESESRIPLPEISASVGPYEEGSCSPRAVTLLNAVNAWEASDKQQREKTSTDGSLTKQQARPKPPPSIPYENFQDDLLTRPAQVFFNEINQRTRFEKYNDLLSALTHLSGHIGQLQNDPVNNTTGLQALLKYQAAIEGIFNSATVDEKISAFRQKEMPWVTELTWRLILKIENPTHQENITRGVYIAKKLSRYMDMKQCIGGATLVLAGAGASVSGAGGNSSALFYKGSRLFWKSIRDRTNKGIAAIAACHIFTDDAYAIATPSSQQNMNRRLR